MAPLAGLRVLDLGRLVAAPWCTQILADLGAEVIKIEKAGRGDELRYYGPAFLGEMKDQSGQFIAANRNKKSLSLDISDPRGQDIVRRIAGKSHILIENFKAGDLRRYGLDHESLRKINPKLVYCSITGFGQSGPYAGRPGVDSAFQAMSGLMSVTGAPDAPPQKVGTFVVDILTGVYAVASILAALRHTEINGAQGARVDMALLDVAMAMMAMRSSEYLVGKEEPRRLGNATSGSAPAYVFECADGYLDIQAGNEEAYRRLCDGLGLPELKEDTRFVTRAQRLKNEPELMGLLKARIAEKSAQHWEGQLSRLNVVCARVRTVSESFEDPYIDHRKIRVRDDAGSQIIANPIRIDGQEISYRAAPRLGQHTDEVLRDLLGMGAADIDGLRKDGVV